MASDICKVLNIILLVTQLEKQNMDIFYFYFNTQGVLNNKTDKFFPISMGAETSNMVFIDVVKVFSQKDKAKAMTFELSNLNRPKSKME